MKAGWTPTPAHFRAVAVVASFAVVAVLDRRPDLLVVAAPCLAVVVWTEWTRPARSPRIESVVDHPTLREGDTTTWRLVVDDASGRTEDVAVAFRAPDWVALEPAHVAELAGVGSRLPTELSVEVRPVRWGPHRLDPPLVVAAGAWNGHRHVWRSWHEARELLAMPHAPEFDAVASAAPPHGLVGVNRAPRPGAGSEFASIRPFQPGDRLRRIHWPRTLRSREMHVTSTWSDTDRHVVLLVDAFEDIGEPGGVDGAASSLDISVRAASAIAGHFTRTGDRISLVSMEAHRVRRLQPASGERHLRRVVRALAEIRPATTVDDRGTVPRGLRGAALVVMLSPLLSPGALDRVARIARDGTPMVVIDCLPPHVTASIDRRSAADLAWRLERLERDRRLEPLRAHGVPVMPWRGPGTLDPVLAKLSRRRPGVGRP